MTVVERKCFSLSCNGCGNECDFDYVPHFDSADEASDHAKEMDWFVRGGVHLCEGCSPIAEEECDDCGHFADEVCDKHLAEHLERVKKVSA